MPAPNIVFASALAISQRAALDDQYSGGDCGLLRWMRRRCFAQQMVCSLSSGFGSLRIRGLSFDRRHRFFTDCGYMKRDVSPMGMNFGLAGAAFGQVCDGDGPAAQISAPGRRS